MKIIDFVGLLTSFWNANIHYGLFQNNLYQKNDFSVFIIVTAFFWYLF